MRCLSQLQICFNIYYIFYYLNNIKLNMIFYKHFLRIVFCIFKNSQHRTKWKNLKLLKLWNKDKLNCFNRISSKIKRQNDKREWSFWKSKIQIQNYPFALRALVTWQTLFIHSICKQTWVPNALLSLKAQVFINKCIHRRLPALFLKVFLGLFRNSLRATDLNHCHSLLLGIQSVILLSLWHRNVCKLISALSLVHRRVNHVQYSNIYGILIGGWKNHAVFTLMFTTY